MQIILCRCADVQVVDVQADLQADAQTDMQADMQADIMQADMQHVHVHAGEDVKMCKRCCRCCRCREEEKCRGTADAGVGADASAVQEVQCRRCSAGGAGGAGVQVCSRCAAEGVQRCRDAEVQRIRGSEDQRIDDQRLCRGAAGVACTLQR